MKYQKMKKVDNLIITRKEKNKKSIMNKLYQARFTKAENGN